MPYHFNIILVFWGESVKFAVQLLFCLEVLDLRNKIFGVVGIC